MLTKCKAIIIKSIDYSESSVIVKCFTNHYGMQSYLINGVRKQKGAIRPSQLLPLSLLNLEAYHQQNKNLQRIKELRCEPQLKQLHFQMTKSAIGMFIAEVIYRAVKEENHPDSQLFEFLFQFIQLLDEEDEQALSNLPLYFLLQIARLMGIAPKFENVGTGTLGFNFKDGQFEWYDDKNPFQFSLVSSELLMLCLPAGYNEIREMQIAGVHRRQLIQDILIYFNEHISGFSNMKSHEILATVLA